MMLTFFDEARSVSVILTGDASLITLLSSKTYIDVYYDLDCVFTGVFSLKEDMWLSPEERYCFWYEANDGLS